MRTYGTLHRVAAGWAIADLEPHVAIAFKRLFPRVAVTSGKRAPILLSDSDAIRADLAWFTARYPLATDHGDDLQAGVQRLQEAAAERDRILSPEWTPSLLTGFRPGREPYAYQRQAATIALRNPGLLIGDDVGLGKTISAIAALVDGAPLPAAIVVQPHLTQQWHDRIREFTELRVHIIKGTQPYSLPPADVYIFRYSNIAGWRPLVAKGGFPTVVYDEVQELRKGHSTAKGLACHTASEAAKLRIGLTATPVYNYGDEMHTVMGFIQPDLLGSMEEFVREWCGGGRVVKSPDALGAYLRDSGYFLRRTENDPMVDKSMPPTNVIDYQVDFDSSAADAEAALTRSLAMAVMNGSFVEAGQAARELDLKMRQLTGIGKAKAVAAYVRLLLGDAPRVLLAGWHREVYDIWQAELAAFNPVLYTGSETSAGKGRSVEAFTTGSSRVMIISLRSGAGLDGLQHHCRDVVFGELDWSPQVHHQVIGRLRRPGQSGQVTAHYLHSADGSDPVLLEMLGIKSDQARGISDPGAAQAARFTDDSRIRRLAAAVLERAMP